MKRKKWESPCARCPKLDRVKNTCEASGTCKGCASWAKWFCEYWNGLREKYLPGLKEMHELLQEMPQNAAEELTNAAEGGKLE